MERTARAAHRVGAEFMVLHRSEAGEHMVPAPVVEAGRCPAVIILRLAADINHAVDATRPAQRAAADPLLGAI